MPDSGIAVVVLLGLVGLRWVLLGIGAALILRPVDRCPACMGETHEVHRPLLRRFASWLEWRWCLACGWSGPARRLPQRPPPRAERAPRVPVR